MTASRVVPDTKPESVAPLYPQTESPLVQFFMWRNMWQTLPVFLGGNLFIYLITYGEMSVTTILAYICLVLIALATGLNTLLKFSNNQRAVETLEVEEVLRADQIKNLTRTLNQTHYHARRLLRGDDYLITAKVAGGLLVVAMLGKVFSGLTLLYLTFVAVFCGPKVYEEKTAEIDALAATARVELGKLSRVAEAKLRELYVLAKDKIQATATPAASKAPASAATAAEKKMS